MTSAVSPAAARRRFAEKIVRRLREAGYEALWAGGCVRDQVLGVEPKDYDVATSAEPESVRELFGRRRTLAIGAAFGVITVLGRRDEGQVEVATFREDFEYADGRRPGRVVFSHAEADARRRDFTINGLFFDPIDERVLDFVGGQDDLRRGVVRAIGDAVARFDEDKLRMLRAVRFAARFDFEIETETFQAIAAHAGDVGVVSVERVATEMQAILTGPHRDRAWRLLVDSGLAGVVTPEVSNVSQAAELLAALEAPTLASALVVLLGDRRRRPDAERLTRRWKLSNKDRQRISWLLDHAGALTDAESRPWSQVQPMLVDAGIEELIDVQQAQDAVAGSPRDWIWIRGKLALPPEELDPPPLVTGDDLLRAGFRPGRWFGPALAAIRAGQLDGELADGDAALALAAKFRGETS